MAGENEPAKLLLPYLQRADELQKHDPLVAYYCRLYAMERGLRIPQSERTKTTNSLLVSLMKQLEKDKKSLKLGPEDNLHLEGFALNVFEKADKQDRGGRSDLITAKTFYAASIFFEILNQFGALQPDLEEKQKYAVWKAADIRKALKEGRRPTPGPPAGDDDLSLDSLPSNTTSGAYNLGPSETAVTGAGPESFPSPQFPDKFNDQYSTHIPPSPQAHDKDNYHHSTSIPPAVQFDKDSQHPTHVSSSSPPSYPTPSYPSHDPSYRSDDFHPPPATNRSENPTYSHPYPHQSYAQEPQQHLPSNYPSHEASSSYPYQHFQSYPSFSDSSLPAVPLPPHYPSYYQGSDASYSHQPAPPATNYTSAAPYHSSSTNGSVSEPSTTTAQTYQYDSNYQPPAEKIAEAHKAARFAVGALAFDDVSVAVDFLKKSLELLTKPSAGQ